MLNICPVPDGGFIALDESGDRRKRPPKDAMSLQIGAAFPEAVFQVVLRGIDSGGGQSGLSFRYRAAENPFGRLASGSGAPGRVLEMNSSGTSLPPT